MVHNCISMSQLPRLCHDPSCPYVAPHADLRCVFECVGAPNCSAATRLPNVTPHSDHGGMWGCVAQFLAFYRAVGVGRCLGLPWVVADLSASKGSSTRVVCVWLRHAAAGPNFEVQGRAGRLGFGCVASGRVLQKNKFPSSSGLCEARSGKILARHLDRLRAHMPHILRVPKNWPCRRIHPSYCSKAEPLAAVVTRWWFGVLVSMSRLRSATHPHNCRAGCVVVPRSSQSLGWRTLSR